MRAQPTARCRRITLADHQAIIVRGIFAGRVRWSDWPDFERLVQRYLAPATARFAFIGQFLIRREVAAGRDGACNHLAVLPRRDNAFQPRPGLESYKG